MDPENRRPQYLVPQRKLIRSHVFFPSSESYIDFTFITVNQKPCDAPKVEISINSMDSKLLCPLISSYSQQPKKELRIRKAKNTSLLMNQESQHGLQTTRMQL